MRKGDWKVLATYDRDHDGLKAYQLYNLREDISESNDLSAAEPARLDAMSREMLLLYREIKAEGPMWDSAKKPEPRGVFAAARASSERGDNVAVAAIDGNNSTRWESVHGKDPQWLELELKEQRDISSVTIEWEQAAASQYDVMVSRDGESWQEAASVLDGEKSEKRVIHVTPTRIKFIKIIGKKRLTGWGHSIWEVSVR